MKNLFIILLICICANVQAQTLVNFTTTQQTQLRNFVAAELKKATDRIATLETKATTQATLIATLRDSVKLLSKPNVFDTSFATVTKGATFNTITGNFRRITQAERAIAALPGTLINSDNFNIYFATAAAPLATRVTSLELKASPSGADFTLLKQYIDNLRTALTNLPK